MNFRFSNVVSLVLAGVFLTALVACGADDTSPEPGDTNNAANNVSNNASNNSAANNTSNNASTDPKPEVGEAWPAWSLNDFQPQSERFEESYGLEAFEGKVTLVAFFAGWCGYCRSQALILEGLLQELREEGHNNIQFVSVNAITANEEGYQKALVYQLDDNGDIMTGDDGGPVYRCSFPLFQDTEGDSVWDLHKGSKDDFFIYGTDGKLLHWLPIRGDVDTNLSHEEARAGLKSLLLEAASE